MERHLRKKVELEVAKQGFYGIFLHCGSEIMFSIKLESCSCCETVRSLRLLTTLFVETNKQITRNSNFIIELVMKNIKHIL